jgi:hypothetical protein
MENLNLRVTITPAHENAEPIYNNDGWQLHKAFSLINTIFASSLLSSLLSIRNARLTLLTASIEL